MTGEWLGMPEGSLEITFELLVLRQQLEVSLTVISTNEVRRNLIRVQVSSFKGHQKESALEGKDKISRCARNDRGVARNDRGVGLK